MDINEFRQDLTNDIRTEFQSTGASYAEVFIRKMTELMREAECLTDEVTPSFYTGVSRKRQRNMRVDGYLEDNADNSLYLFIVEFENSDDPENMTKTRADKCIKMLDVLLEEATTTELFLQADESNSVYPLLEMLYKERNDFGFQRIHYIILTNGKRSVTLKNITHESVCGRPVDCQVWDIERLYEIFSSTRQTEEIVVDFREFGSDGIPCLEACRAEKEGYISYLCVIQGKLLADIYGRYGARLLEGNVRSFLSTKVAVNKKIRQTILNEPDKFFAFNNGIAVTAREPEFSCDGRLLSVKDFQIINGGQTTASLASASFKDKADLTKIFVQMKLSCIQENVPLEDVEKLVRDISKSSNSQNKVSEADFFATHPFHIEMEKISRRLWAPAVGGAQNQTKWFYERSRGQFLQAQMRMSKSERDKFLKQNPKTQAITKTDFAKYRMSWEEHPDDVSRGAQTNFMKFADLVDKAWGENNTVFNDNYFRETVAIAIIFKTLEEQVSSEEWYDSYRANIVTYSIALFHRATRMQYKNKVFDLQKIWNLQKLPDSLVRAFRDITRDVNDFINRDDRGVKNVTQWCKQKTCWDKMQKEVTVRLPIDEDNLFKSLEEARAEGRAAKLDQKFVNDMEALKKTYSISPVMWTKITQDAMKYRLIAGQKELTALKSASKGVQQDFQAKILLDILERMREEGHVYE